MFIREGVDVGGKEFSIETGRMAKQADGSVVVRYGDSMVLVTAVAATSVRPGIDFMPLTVDYLSLWKNNTAPSRMADYYDNGLASGERKQVVFINEVLPRLFDVTNRLAARITSVDILEPNLEAVFLHLTGRALRD